MKVFWLDKLYIKKDSRLDFSKKCGFLVQRKLTCKACVHITKTVCRDIQIIQSIGFQIFHNGFLQFDSLYIIQYGWFKQALPVDSKQQVVYNDISFVDSVTQPLHGNRVTLEIVWVYTIEIARL